MSQKDELEMLTVIECRAIEYIREMQEYTINDNQALLKEEQKCKKNYASERTARTMEKDANEYARKKEEYFLRSKQSVITAGRRSMHISKKAETKKIEKAPERDEDAENMLKYLGEVAVDLNEVIKKAK